MDAPGDRGATLQGHTHVSHADTLAGSLNLSGFVAGRSGPDT